MSGVSRRGGLRHPAKVSEMLGALPVTVIIPAYNAAATIEDAIVSVIAQSRSPLEILVVDDGSSDATATVARQAGADVVSQPNGGVAAARNRGVTLARQPWVAFLDADDLWEPDRLQAQWVLHERYPDVPLVVSDYSAFVDGAASGGTVSGGAVMATLRRYRRMHRRRLDGGAFVARRALLDAIVRGNFVLPSTLLVERRIFTERGVYFAAREDLPSGRDFFVGEDLEWLVRVLDVTDALVVERPLARYRLHPGSLSELGARLRYGDVKLGEWMHERPERYACEARAAFRRMRPRHLCEAGLRFLSAGDVPLARAMFARAVRERPGPQSLALAAATAPLGTPGGARWFAQALAAWRRRRPARGRTA